VRAEWDISNFVATSKVLDLILSFKLILPLLQLQILLHNSLPNILNVIHDGFEMTRRIVTFGDVDLVLASRTCRNVKRCDRDKLVMDGSEESKTWSDLLFWSIGLDECGDNSDINVLGADIMG